MVNDKDDEISKETMRILKSYDFFCTKKAECKQKYA